MAGLSWLKRTKSVIDTQSATQVTFHNGERMPIWVQDNCDSVTLYLRRQRKLSRFCACILIVSSRPTFCRFATVVRQTLDAACDKTGLSTC